MNNTNEKYDLLIQFVTLPFAEKILNTGKYLNVVSDCGVEIEQREEPLRYLVNPRQLEGAINKCYEYSAKCELNFMFFSGYINWMRFRTKSRSG